MRWNIPFFRVFSPLASLPLLSVSIPFSYLLSFSLINSPLLLLSVSLTFSLVIYVFYSLSLSSSLFNSTLLLLYVSLFLPLTCCISFSLSASYFLSPSHTQKQWFNSFSICVFFYVDSKDLQQGLNLIIPITGSNSAENMLLYVCAPVWTMVLILEGQ